jgi:hypothetical protein
VLYFEGMKIINLFTSKRAAEAYLKLRGWEVRMRYDGRVHFTNPLIAGERVVEKTAIREVWKIVA